MDTTDMRSLSRDARHERRVQVIRLRKAGYSYDAIATQTGLSRTGVFDICKRHADGGAKALHDRQGGRRAGERRLSGEQEAEIPRLICDKTPDQLKMPYALWTRGATPLVRISHRREGLSVISTVTNRGQLRWKIFEGALNAGLLIAFLRRLTKSAGRKDFLILDNLWVRHSKLVKAWLARHSEAIEVFFLPSYSRELNPEELAHADLKQAVTRKAPARAKAKLIKAAASHLRGVQKQPKRVRRHFEHDPVRYAA